MTRKPPSPWSLPEGQSKKIPEEQLLFDPENPRFVVEQTDDQDKLLEVLWNTMAVDELVLSIANNGYFPLEVLLVVPGPVRKGQQTYYVAEGNRRLAAVRLLRHQELRDMVKALDLPTISKEDRDRLAELPCVIYRNRREIWRYTGFRHINGIKAWDSFAKAKYVAQIRDWDSSLSLDEVANFVGDRHSTVKRFYQGYLVTEQADSAGYDLDENPDAKQKFSHLYTALGYPPVRKFLGLTGKDFSKKNPVPKSHAKDLRQLMVWLYGDTVSKTTPAVHSQNPDVRRLADVLGNTKALEALRDGGFTLDEAHRLAYDDVERFKGSLIRAKEELQKAKGLALSYPGDPETLDVVERIFELATALREELTRRSHKPSSRAAA